MRRAFSSKNRRQNVVYLTEFYGIFFGIINTLATSHSLIAKDFL